ncbi:MAG: Transcription regulator, Lrp/AsnC family [archaeon GW2011_AR9]|nr:MAG: Transcription regulator, Lrp/AsnC family [archaeon GW2011_AR9]MBS3120431.1 Lrp/AsnC family transcriptional regulator [Candidatus Woesearchaeota archaeon]HIH13073.1 Lrp/AsnC family transcriptional regulator [Candidatus Woesearchaeota archaeon]
MVRLHVKDMKILRELDFGARQPISQIARKVGLSPEVTAYRIKQLEKQGIITGYYPVIDLSKLGYMFCRFRLIVENVDSEIEEKFINAVKNIPQLGWIIFGSSCLVSLIVYAKSIQEASEIYQQIARLFPGVIKSKAFSIAHKIYHFRRNYLYNTEEDEQLIWGEGGKVEIDEIDRKILVLLIHDARIKYTELAAKVGLTSMAVLNRIKRLQRENLLLGTRCKLNVSKLGYSHYKISLLIDKITTERKNSLKQLLRQSPNVVYITEALGPYDLEFEMDANSEQQVHQFLKKIKEKFPEIKGFENTTFYRMEILRYFPEKIN